MITEHQVREKLQTVHDPHVPVPIADMGMLRDIDIAGNSIRVEICVPCMACPGTDKLVEDITESLSELSQDVTVSLGFHLPWDRDMVTDEVKDLMRINGIQI